MKPLPIEDALKACAEIGYRNVELTLMPGYPTEPKLLSPADRNALREALARHRLSVSGLMDNLSLALDGVIWSAFGTSGQRCTAASRLIVQRGILDELTERLIARTEALRLGHGLDEGTDVGPVVNHEQLAKIDGYMEVARQEGATIACGGSIANVGALAKGFFFRPTVLTDVKPTMRVAQEEIFGPVIAVIAVDSLEEAIAVNNDVPFGLSSSIYTRDVNQAFRAIEGITTGLLYVNAGTIGAEVHLPFGGTRGTGNGHREAGQAALDTYTEWKTVFVDYSGKLQRAQIDVKAPSD
jgi:aldehyde dehydrogenase (NAD+)